MVPHSLMISKVSVALYLQIKVENTVQKLFNKHYSNNFVAILLVDDIIVLGNDPKMISEFHNLMEKWTEFNKEKLEATPAVTPLMSAYGPLLDEKLTIGTIAVQEMVLN